MKPFSKVTSVACPLFLVDIDTDQILPKQFLTRIDASGYSDCLFYDWRFGADGTANPSFPLNRPEWKDAHILVAGPNFGCGSSREHAVWALRDYGIRAIIAPSFGDIFRNNCSSSGLLAVAMPEDDVRGLLSSIEQVPRLQVTVDLVGQVITFADAALEFSVDTGVRNLLLSGLDRIQTTLQHVDSIDHYERQRPSWLQREIH